MASTPVYFFYVYDIKADKPVYSTKMGTIAAIEAARGTRLPETQRLVPAQDVDGNGFYIPPDI